MNRTTTPAPWRLSMWYLATALSVGWSVILMTHRGGWVLTILMACVLVGLWQIGSVVLPEAAGLLPPRRTSPLRWYRLAAGGGALLLVPMALVVVEPHSEPSRIGAALFTVGIALAALPRYQLAVLRAELARL